MPCASGTFDTVDTADTLNTFEAGDRVHQHLAQRRHIGGLDHAAADQRVDLGNFGPQHAHRSRFVAAADQHLRGDDLRLPAGTRRRAESCRWR